MSFDFFFFFFFFFLLVSVDVSFCSVEEHNAVKEFILRFFFGGSAAGCGVAARFVVVVLLLELSFNETVEVVTVCGAGGGPSGGVGITFVVVCWFVVFVVIFNSG